jgi:hypothetical protein
MSEFENDKRFIVRARRSVELSAVVWAESAEEAINIAEAGVDWEADEQVDEIYEAEEGDNA